MPAQGLYPYQWCWDSGPIALGWAAAGEWEFAWTELERLMTAQWPSGMVPHIAFWEEDGDYFPGPSVWATGRNPATTGITQPPLPVTSAARLYQEDPDRDRALSRFRELAPALASWLSWLRRARSGPHGACVIVHPWESGMDNSPSWDQPLAAVAEVSNEHIERRDVRTVSADQRPSQREYRQYLGIVEALRSAGWDTERQPQDGPFAVEDPAFTAIAARAASDLAVANKDAGLDGHQQKCHAKAWLEGLERLWDDQRAWYRPFDVKTQEPVGPVTSTGLITPWAAIPHERLRRILERIDSWAECGLPTTDPDDPAFDPIRYWRGPVWVLTNWLVAEGLAAHGLTDRADDIGRKTRTLVERGFDEYYDPRDGHGIGGHGFSWSAALTLDWLTK